MERTKGVITVYNPVNEMKIKEQSLCNCSKLSSSSFNVITAGRLTYQKGYDRLVKIHKRLIDEGVIHHLYILGQGEEYESLSQFIKENKLDKTVTLLGFQSNPYIYIKQADLFVCSSRSEGFSTVATEAAILGIPIVTTLCSGMRELLGNSEYGLITENNTDSLYEGLKQMIIDKELYANYQKMIRIKGSEFTIKRSVQKIEELFLEVI